MTGLDRPPPLLPPPPVESEETRLRPHKEVCKETPPVLALAYEGGHTIPQLFPPFTFV